MRSGCLFHVRSLVFAIPLIHSCASYAYAPPCMYPSLVRSYGVLSHPPQPAAGLILLDSCEKKFPIFMCRLACCSCRSRILSFFARLGRDLCCPCVELLASLVSCAAHVLHETISMAFLNTFLCFACPAFGACTKTTSISSSLRS